LKQFYLADARQFQAAQKFTREVFFGSYKIFLKAVAKIFLGVIIAGTKF
jgi:hypothetical protein